MTVYRYPVLGRLMLDGDLYDPIEMPDLTIDLDEEVAADLPDGVLGKGSPLGDAGGGPPPAPVKKGGKSPA